MPQMVFSSREQTKAWLDKQSYFLSSQTSPNQDWNTFMALDRKQTYY